LSVSISLVCGICILISYFLTFNFYPRDQWHSAVFATATCPSVRPSVCHSRYCVETTKPIWKLFRPSGFSTPCADTQFQGEPIQRGR